MLCSVGLYSLLDKVLVHYTGQEEGQKLETLGLVIYRENFVL